VTPLGSIDAVVLAVQEDARAEIDSIERDLAATIARLRDVAPPSLAADADGRIAAAHRIVRERFAAEDWADHQVALSDREAWIQRVMAEGERTLGALDSAARRADVAAFVREALDRLPPAPVELLVPAGEVDTAEALIREGTFTASGKVITRVAATSEIVSGCLVQTADGHIRYDNSHCSRAKRFESVWRARLCELYERQLSSALAGDPRSPKDPA
jgi:vacuolar-type H+-ATPase subunit E/Vma4